MKNLLLKIIKNSYFQAGFIVIFVFLIFTWITQAPNFLDADPFYHAKIALFLKQGKIVQNFPWMYFTSYRNNYVDHHFLFHIIQAGFLFLPSGKNLDPLSLEIEPLLKINLAACLLAALIFLTLFLILKHYQLKGAFFFSLLPLLSNPFVLRMSLARAMSLSVTIFLICLFLILKKKYFLLFIFSYLWVLAHGTWPLLIILVLVYILADFLLENNRNFLIRIKNIFKKENLKLISSTFLGMLAGLIINPYFPKTFSFYWSQTVKIAVLDYSKKISQSAEWAMAEPWHYLFLSSFIIFVFYLIFFGFYSVSKKKNKKTLFLFLLSLFFLLYTIKARRNVDYFIPSAVLFIAFVFNDLIKNLNWSLYLQKFKKFFFFSPSLNFSLALFLTFSLILILNSSIYNSLINVKNTYQSKGFSYFAFQKASHFLKKNLPPKSIIFQTMWDFFPPLFYFNHQNYYVNGLHQIFMYQYSKKLNDQWMKIAHAQTDLKEIEKYLKKSFQAKAIVFNKKTSYFRQEKLNKMIAKSPNFKKVYQDQFTEIYFWK